MMSKSKISFAVIAMIFVVLGYSITEARPITLDSAIYIGLRNNKDIKVAQLELDKANSAIKEAYGYAMPSLDFSAQFSHFIEKPQTPFPDFNALLNNAVYGVLFRDSVLPTDNSKFMPIETKLQSFALANSYSTTLSLQQVLFSSTVFKGISSSGVYRDLAHEALSGKICTTVINIKKAFYGALLSQNLLKITNESFDNAKANLENVKALQKQGLVAEFDALRAEVQVENIRPVVLQMETNLEMIKNNLKIILGIDQSEDIDLVGDLEYNPQNFGDENSLISQAKSDNYDLNTLKIKRNFDEALIDLDISSYYPTIAAFGNYSYSGSSDNFNFQNYSQAIVGLNLSINLFNGFRTSRKVEQGKIGVMQTDENIGQLENAITAQIKTKVIEIKKIQSSIEAQDKNVSLAQRAYDISKLRYKEGQGNQLEIENSDLALRQAKTNKLQSVYQYISAIADLENLTGNLDQKYLRIKLDK